MVGKVGGPAKMTIWIRKTSLSWILRSFHGCDFQNDLCIFHNGPLYLHVIFRRTRPITSPLAPFCSCHLKPRCNIHRSLAEIAVRPFQRAAWGRSTCDGRHRYCNGTSTESAIDLLRIFSIACEEIVLVMDLLTVEILTLMGRDIRSCSQSKSADIKASEQGIKTQRQNRYANSTA